MNGENKLGNWFFMAVEKGIMNYNLFITNTKAYNNTQTQQQN
jgi:hypothetical protein